MREVDLKVPFETPYFQEYYDNYRNKIDDLFDSERRFINDFAKSGHSFLDIGCAVGGMFQILRSLSHHIAYTGVDISSSLILQAIHRYPEAKFAVYDGVRLPFEERQFDCVLTLGTTVHDQNYLQLLLEAWRVTKGKLLFDIRMTPLSEVCALEKGYVNDGAGVRYPYVVVNARQFFSWIAMLPDLAKVNVYGYWGKANEDTTLPKGYERICMACLLLERRGMEAREGERPIFQLELPQELNV